MAKNQRAAQEEQNNAADSCEFKLTPQILEWRKAITQATACRTGEASLREAAAQDICLTSRSVYFDFYTWVVINSRLEPWAKKTLGELFRQSLDVMIDGDYKASVLERQHDFEAICERIENGQLAGSVSSLR